MQDPNLVAQPPEEPIAPDQVPLRDPNPMAADALLADDSRVLQILSAEHSSLLSQRSLAYNEAFERAGMFLTFLSMSFVAMALLAQALAFNRDFLVIASILLGFDFLIGILSYIRIGGTSVDDLHATQGMAFTTTSVVCSGPTGISRRAARSVTWSMACRHRRAWWA